MSPPALRSRSFAVLQRALILLLAVNCALYLVRGTGREAADAIAWFTLLVLFYGETSAQGAARRATAAGLRYARLAAAAVVAVSAWAHFDAAAWLDAGNSALWIAVVVLLEAQVRWPAWAARHRSAFAAAAVLLYGGLCVLPLAWLAQREWLDAYDAVLWLAAFATIEMELWSERPAARAAVSRTPRETPR